MFCCIRALLVGAFLSLLMQPTWAQNEIVQNFSKFVQEGQYDQANFYISQGLVKSAQIDSTQILYNVIADRFDWRIAENLSDLDTLVGYLQGLGPLSLNRTIKCNYDNQCSFGGRLFETGQPLSIIQSFVALGLDLNHRDLGFLPLDAILLVQLGDAYSIDDLNALSAMGLRLGAQPVAVQDFSSFSYSLFESSSFVLPSNYLSLGALNFLDVIIVTLGSLDDRDGAVISAKSDILCSFATYAAANYSPSFDYLAYLLDNRSSFVAGWVGRADDSGRGRNIYMPFPANCVSLVQAMAKSHANLQRVINSMAVKGDIATAQWLIDQVGQAAPTAPAQ